MRGEAHKKNKKKTRLKSGRTYVSRILWSSGFLSRKSRISIRLWVYLREPQNNSIQSLQTLYGNIKPDTQTSYSGIKQHPFKQEETGPSHGCNFNFKVFCLFYPVNSNTVTILVMVT